MDSSGTGTALDLTISDVSGIGWVKDGLKIGKPVRPGDIAKETGLDSKQVSAAFKILKQDGVICSPKRCYYEPSK